MAKVRIRYLLFPAVLFLSMISPCPGISMGLSTVEIQKLQSGLDGKTKAERIAFWAERFIGTPYDRDPQGAYVTRTQILADDEADCMYLTFRAVELALSRSPEEAVQVALEKRFHMRGILRDGLWVQERMKVGDIDPRGVREYCFTISEKARAIAGGVLEAILMRYNK